MSMPSLFSLIVTDVDGCIGAGEGKAYDPDVIRQLADLNRAAQRGEPVPAVTLCTGRPGAYVDAMMQILTVSCRRSSRTAPACTSRAVTSLNGIRPFPGRHARPSSRCAASWRRQSWIPASATSSPGKELALTLFPQPGHTLTEVGAVTERAFAGRDVPCRVEVGVTSIGIWLEGVDKGAGLRWLADETGVPLSRIAAIGDDTGDISFLKLAGYSAAPQNAIPAVKDVVDYVSPFTFGQGVLDIIEQVRARA